MRTATCWERPAKATCPPAGSCFPHPSQKAHPSTPPPPTFSLSPFFFNDTATTEIYTLSLHDALPISTLSYAGGGTLTSFSATRIGVTITSGASTPAWQIAAYDANSNLLGTTGEGNMSTGGFMFPQ